MNIHKFYLNDQYVVLDVESGSVHVVDKLVYDILDDYNTLTKTEIIEKYIGQYDITEISESLDEIDTLVNSGLLFTENKLKFKPIYNPQNIIKAMCLHVSHDCNLRCKYCFASGGDFKGQRGLMTEEVGRRALEFLVENSGNRKNLEVDFFGGEPLMNFSLIEKLVKYGRELEKKYDKNFRFTLTTNGMLLNSKIIKFINENMSNVVLSLDGRKDINDNMRPTVGKRGSYEIIVPKFKELIDERKDKDYFIRATFTNENLDFSEDLKEFYKLGFKKTSIEPVVTDPKEDYALREEHLDIVLEEYEKMSKDYIEIRKNDPEFSFFHFIVDLNQGPCIVKRTVGCGAGSEYVAITPTGEIYPCHQFVGQEEFMLGNIFTGIENKVLRDEFKSTNIYTNEDCPECWARYYCSGGCHANAYYANQDMKKPHKIGCEMEKKRIECAISILANEA